MRSNDDTDIGGSNNEFETTQWTDIGKIRSNDGCRQDLICDLLKKYWKPVYCYLRHKGYGNEQAKDLTQGFFHEVVLGRELIQQADQAKGRFRTFLLTALGRYATDVYRKETTRKRSPRTQMIPLETNDVVSLFERQSESRPDEVFNYAWASEVLNQVLAKVKDDCCSADREDWPAPVFSTSCYESIPHVFSLS